MQTMQANAKITEDRRLRIDMELLKYTPVGFANVEIRFSPFFSETSETLKSIMDFYRRFEGMEAFEGDAAKIQRRLRDDMVDIYSIPTSASRILNGRDCRFKPFRYEEIHCRTRLRPEGNFADSFISLKL